MFAPARFLSCLSNFQKNSSFSEGCIKLCALLASFSWTCKRRMKTGMMFAFLALMAAHLLSRCVCDEE